MGIDWRLAGASGLEPTIPSKGFAVQACAKSNVRFRFRRNSFKVRQIDAKTAA